MSTVFKRVYAYCMNNKQPLLTNKERTEVGLLIAQAYKQLPDKVWINRVKKTEPEGEFMVWNYPESFKPKMDAIISIWFQEHKKVFRGTLPISAPEKPKRKRILKPQYSAAPVNNKA